MSKRVQDNRRQHGGRVTPSKMRRSVVIAVDGALAIGAGALGGLFATGTASAAAPTPGWAPTQSPAPAGPDAPGTNPGTDLNATSCASAVFCAAVGTYEDTGSHNRGLLEALAGGSWSAQEAPLPANADPSFPDPSFKDVSCPTEGWCVAAGYYFDSSGGIYTSFDTLAGGRWTDDRGTGARGCHLRIECPERGHLPVVPGRGPAVAVGYYINSSHRAYGMIDTLSDGTWSRAGRTGAPQCDGRPGRGARCGLLSRARTSAVSVATTRTRPRVNKRTC